MKRLLIISLGIVAFSAGCSQNTDTATRTEEPYTPVSTGTGSSTYNTQPTYTTGARSSGSSLDTLDNSGSGGYSSGGYTTDATVTSEPMYTGSTASSGDETLAPAGGGRVHLVRKGDTLYRLAREYYGQDSRWRDIYAANQGRLNDPHRLAVGMKLIIP